MKYKPLALPVLSVLFVLAGCVNTPSTTKQSPTKESESTRLHDSSGGDTQSDNTSGSHEDESKAVEPIAQDGRNQVHSSSENKASQAILTPPDDALAPEPSPRSDKDALPKPVYLLMDSWCDNREKHEFATRNDTFAGFVLKKGTLSGNIERFVATMYPDSNGLIAKVGRHLVAGDTCITAATPDILMQQIIEPYYAGTVPIVFATFKNDFYALFYKDDPEFVRYRVGVRK